MRSLLALALLFAGLSQPGPANAAPAATYPVCKGGKVYDTLARACIKNPCNAQQGYVWSSKKSRCVSRCDNSWQWDAANFACLSLKEAQRRYRMQKGTPTVGELVRGQVDAQAAAQARARGTRGPAAAHSPEPTPQGRGTRGPLAVPVAKPSACPPGQQRDFSDDLCISRCIGGLWDVEQATCLCPPGQEWEQMENKCKAPLGTGPGWDDLNRRAQEALDD
jgi:hypothetical protein